MVENVLHISTTKVIPDGFGYARVVEIKLEHDAKATLYKTSIITSLWPFLQLLHEVRVVGVHKMGIAMATDTMAEIVILLKDLPTREFLSVSVMTGFCNCVLIIMALL